MLVAIHYLKLVSKVSKGNNSNFITVSSLKPNLGRIWRASKLVFDFSKGDTPDPLGSCRVSTKYILGQVGYPQVLGQNWNWHVGY